MQEEVFPCSPASFTGTADLRRLGYENFVRRKAKARRKQRRESFVTSHSSFHASAQVCVHPKSRGASRRVDSFDDSSCLSQGKPVHHDSSSPPFFPSSFLFSTSPSPAFSHFPACFPSSSHHDDYDDGCYCRHLPPELSLSLDHLRKNLRFRIPPLFQHVYPRSPVTYRLDLRFLDLPRLQISSSSSPSPSFYDADHREHLVEVLSPFLSPFLSSHLHRRRSSLSSTERRKDGLLHVETDSECISFPPSSSSCQAFSSHSDDDDDLLFSLSVLAKHVLRKSPNNQADVSKTRSLANSSLPLPSSDSSSSSCRQSSSSSSSSRGMTSGERGRDHLPLSLGEEETYTKKEDRSLICLDSSFSSKEGFLFTGLPSLRKLKKDAKQGGRGEEDGEAFKERKEKEKARGNKKKKKKKDVYDEFVHALKKAVEEEDRRLMNQLQAEEEEKRRLQEEAERGKERKIGTTCLVVFWV